MNNRTSSDNILRSMHFSPSENNEHKSHNAQNVHTFTITADGKRNHTHTRVSVASHVFSYPSS